MQDRDLRAVDYIEHVLAGSAKRASIDSADTIDAAHDASGGNKSANGAQGASTNPGNSDDAREW